MMIKEKCQVCGQMAVLNKHVRKHGLTSEEYYRKFLMKPGEGLCKVCGKPTGFAGLQLKCFHPYCSNKCHNSDSEYLAERSKKRKSKSPDEKAAIREKQIAAWTKTMGENWSIIMANRGFETYKQRTGYDTPWNDPTVKNKCKEHWNGENTPANLTNVQQKISNSLKEYYENTKTERIMNKLKKIQERCENIVSYDGHWCEYLCPQCLTKTKFGNKALSTAIKYNTFNHLCGQCHCMNGTSFKEKEFAEYIKSFGENVILNDRSILQGKELDVVLPDLNIAFEFDGTYWHADSRLFSANDVMRSKDGTQITAQMIWRYDYRKVELCREKGIELYRIREYDWESNEINIKHKISEVIKDAKSKYE